MTREKLFKIAYDCGYKPGNNPASVILEIRKKLQEYFDSDEGKAYLRTIPKSFNYNNIDGSGSAQETERDVNSLINALLDMINKELR